MSVNRILVSHYYNFFFPLSSEVTEPGFPIKHLDARIFNLIKLTVWRKYFYPQLSMLVSDYSSTWYYINRLTHYYRSSCLLFDKNLYEGRKIRLGVCAMAKKVKSKPMHEILKRLSYFAFLEIVIFEEEVNISHPDCILHYYAYVTVMYLTCNL